MLLSAIILFTAKGETLLSRLYRGDLSRSAVENFRTTLLGASSLRTPIVTIGDTTFFYILIENIFVATATKQNANAAAAFEVLHKFVTISRAYLHGKFDEEAIRTNFVILYEVLDEIMDFGYPQTTDSDILKLYITHHSSSKLQTEEQIQKVIAQVTGATPWRSNNIFYNTNEIYIDVIELLNILVSNKGTILRADVAGKVNLKCRLSGMPECRFGINDKLLADKETPNNRSRRRSNAIALDDCTFHQCVRLGKFDHDRTITFVPPDGEFELMRYRITDSVRLPFRLLPIVKDIGRTHMEYNITVKSTFAREQLGTRVVIKIPTPKNTALTDIKVSFGAGSAKYMPAESAIVWKIRQFPGDTEFNLSASIVLSASVSGKTGWSRPPISLQFTVPFAVSGLYVRYLKVVENKMQYPTFKWVRYLSKAGQFYYRI